MPEHDQGKETPLEKGEGYGKEPPQPTAAAASAVEAIGPGALAAEENTKTSDELTPDDIETLSGLVQRAGGADKLIQWLKLHPSFK